MKSVFLTILTICFFLFNANAQKELNKEKYNSNKNMEDEIGYAQGVKVGNTIYVSGSVGWGKTEEAIKHAYDKIAKTLKNYGATFQHVVKENLYATTLDSVIKHKDVRKKYYGNDFPAATWVEVNRLYTPELVIEVEVIAILPEDK